MDKHGSVWISVLAKPKPKMQKSVFSVSKPIYVLFQKLYGFNFDIGQFGFVGFCFEHVGLWMMVFHFLGSKQLKVCCYR